MTTLTHTTSVSTTGRSRGESTTLRLAKPDPHRGTAVAMTAMFIFTLPAIIGLLIGFKPPEPFAREAQAIGIPRSQIVMGEATFMASCAVCHGPDATGIAKIGKPLRNSAFVQESTHEELIEIVTKGRAPSDPLNTSGALMPARGARGLSDGEIERVVYYLRAIQDPDAPTVNVDAWIIDRESADGTSLATIELTDHPAYDLYISSCSSCHGPGAQGVEGTGLPLATSGFIRGKSDKDLVTFIKMGRPVWDENSVTGVDMPPKGGNPAITDEQLQAIVDYLRDVQKKALEG